MEDLVKNLMDKVSLEREKAEEVADTVGNFVKDKLPEPLAGLVGKALDGSADALDSLAGLAGKLPGGVGEKLGDILGGGSDAESS